MVRGDPVGSILITDFGRRENIKLGVVVGCLNFLAVFGCYRTLG